jgi:hypothetical protein
MMQILKTPKPKGPWLRPGDLDHNLAVEIALPNLIDGQLVNIKFANEQLKNYQEMIEGKLVISVSMNRQLFGRFIQFQAANKRPPTAIPLEDYPFHQFVPFVINTHSRLGNQMVPRGTRCVAFFAKPRIMKIK